MVTKKLKPPESEPPRIGETLAQLRDARSLSLDALSRMAGVSKSMLSQIERAQANPTVAVVWRLANALGVPMVELLGVAPADTAPNMTLVPTQATPSLRSPDGLCELRILGPIELAGKFEWYELRVQPGGKLESLAHEPGTQEHLTLTTGALEVRSGADSLKVKPGETARYRVDCPHAIFNSTKAPANAWLVVIHPD